MDIIYSRKNFKFLRGKKIAKRKVIILLVLAILICMFFYIIEGIYPIFTKLCKNEAHNIASNVANEEVRKSYEKLLI